MTVDPDAPWWVNNLIIVVLASIPIVLALRTAGRSTRAAEGSQEQATATQEQLNRVLHNVENSHQIGLRDDLDNKVTALATQMAAVGVQVGALSTDVGLVHTELRSTREDVSGVHAELREVRADERLIRQRVNALETGAEVSRGSVEIMPSQALFPAPTG